jgi:AcrR family transcriptional regulator
MASMNATATRQTADERRDALIQAAMKEFAVGGFAGTSAETIARRVGVSQPYLFQLFGTKKELFIAAVRACFGDTRAAFEAAARRARVDGADPHAILMAVGETYMDMLADRDRLRLQLQAYAACDDPEIRQVVREEFAALYRVVARTSGGDPDALEAWFAHGMLLNVAASMGEIGSIRFPLRSTLGGAALDEA